MPKEMEAGYGRGCSGSAYQGETGVGQNVFWEVGNQWNSDCEHGKRLCLRLDGPQGRLDGGGRRILRCRRGRGSRESSHAEGHDAQRRGQ